MPRRKATTSEQRQEVATTYKPKKSRLTNGEGSFHVRGDGRIEIRLSLPDGRRKSVYGKNRKEAVAKAKKLQQQIEENTYVSPRRETVADHLLQWLLLQRLEWKDGTYVQHRGRVEYHLIPTFGHIQLQKLTREQIQSFYNDLRIKHRLKAGTIRNIHVTLHMALKQAVIDRKIAINPAANVTLPKVEKKERRYLTMEEIHRLLEAAKDHPRGGIFSLAVLTGMRQGELLALKWEDIDFEKSLLQVNRSLSYYNVEKTGFTYKEVSPKTASSKRTILLPTRAVTALRQHRLQQIEARMRATEWHDLGLVFPNKKGQHQSPITLICAFKRFLRDAGIADANFHATRHGHATSLFELGENPRVVQERLGHSNVSITLNIYGHVTPTMQQQAIARLNTQFGGE